MNKIKLLITGGAGFIGSHVVRHFVKKYNNYQIYNLDNLTYAGNLENLTDIEGYSNYKFLYGDIADKSYVKSIFEKYRFNSIIHLAAESHVDRSINNPDSFIKTNVLGTLCLLNNFKNLWSDSWHNKIFYHVSTDEVYGSLGIDGFFTEDSPYSPNSPYSASKASSDHLVRAYGETYDLPYLISNCSNNYGSYQFPEKLIPLFINNIIHNKVLPVYGNGKNIRDWLYVNDHINAIDIIFHQAKIKSTYNIGGFNEIKNIDLIHMLCEKVDKKLNRKMGSSLKLIQFIQDREGHDYRYAIDATKLNKDLGWYPSLNFEKGLDLTIDWYLNNESWLENIFNGNYRNYNVKQS